MNVNINFSLFKLLVSFYLIDKNGMLNFCKYPKNIQNYDDIFWAPIYPHGVENPWGVKILNIKIEFENQ